MFTSEKYNLPLIGKATVYSRLSDIITYFTFDYQPYP